MDLARALELAEHRRPQAQESYGDVDPRPMRTRGPNKPRAGHASTPEPAEEIEGEIVPKLSPAEWNGYVERVARQLALELHCHTHWYDMSEARRERWRTIAAAAIQAVASTKVQVKLDRIKTMTAPSMEPMSAQEIMEREAAGDIDGYATRVAERRRVA